MANIGNIGTNESLQNRLTQTARNVGQKIQEFLGGTSVDVGERISGARREGGEQSTVEEESSTPTPMAAHPLGYGSPETARPAMAATHPLGYGRPDVDQMAATVATMPAASEVAEAAAGQPQVNGRVDHPNQQQVGQMLIDTETGEVLQDDINELPAESIAESVLGGSSIASTASPAANENQSAEEQDTAEAPRRRRIVGRNVNPWTPRDTPAQAPAPRSERRPEDPYDAAERVMRNYEQARQIEAQDQDESVVASYTQARRNNPAATPGDYLANRRLSNESFRNMAVLPGEDVGETSDEYEAEIAESGLRDAPDETLDVETTKNTAKQDRLIRTTVNDIVRGFFHLLGERTETNDEGIEVLKWDDTADAAMTRLMRYFNINGIDGQRTVFRLVRLYASMSIDRNGKMFGEDGKWSLTSGEFAYICDLILQSCRENGHPMGIVSGNAELRNTPIFPCGVMPKVVAQAICNPGSNLRCSPSELVQRCQDEWTTRTLPAIRRNTEHEDQIIVILDMARAISMIDGMTAERFSERYNVSTTLDYHISEYKDRNKQYAAAMNNSVDAEAVVERSDWICDQYQQRFDQQRGFSRVVDHEGQEHYIQNKEKSWVSGLKFSNKLARAGGIALNIGVHLGAFGERAVGNLRTRISIWAMGSSYEVSDFTMERIHSDESVEAFQCVKELYDAFGAGAVRLFERSGLEYTKENVSKFARENLRSLTSERVEIANRMLDNFTHRLLTADYAFKRDDVDLWFRAYLAANKAGADVQQKLAERGELSQREVPLTGSEIDSAVRSYTTMGRFFAEAMGSDYGIEAYKMMKANNIGQISPWNYAVDQVLRDHAVTDTIITQFIDTYPRYGLNFVYMLTPFSRTISYLNYKMHNADDARNPIMRNELKGDVVIGGNYEDFATGLRMNLIYDAMTIGHSLLIGGIVGVVLNMLGFDEPWDDRNKNNASMWVIGKKVGWGEDHDGDGEPDGIEIQMAWWMNDITLLSMPIAYLTAGYLSTGDLDQAKKLMFSGLHDTVDGNVILDFCNTVKNFRTDYIEFNKMIEDDSYEGPDDLYSFATLEFQQYMLNLLTGKKWNPLNPLMNTINRDTLIAGQEARNRDYGKVYDKSDEWHKQNGITTPVGYDDYLRRKYTSSNLLYAFLCNKFINRGDESKTGYFWWEMPPRTMGDNLGYAWISKYAMDYSQKPADVTTEQWEEEMADKVLSDITYFQENGGIEKAIESGYMIPKDARKATLNVLFSRRNNLDNEWAARLESGELNWYVDREPEYVRYAEERQKINTLIFDWLKNDDIPMWGETYEQLLTDYELTYVYEDTGQPASETEMFSPGVVATWVPKGNHPTSILPFTVVDTKDRGFNAETINSWYKEGPSGSDLKYIFDTIGQTELKFGRDAGMILNDSLFGKQTLTDEYKALEGPPTINYRSYVSKDLELDEEIKEFDETKANGGTLGDAGKFSQDAQDVISGKAKQNGNASSDYTTYWPRYTYGGSGRGGGGSYSGNYNPKIYSNPRSVNADRAATMYTKAPQSARTTYLNPRFSTKGSREAYKRQDI